MNPFNRFDPLATQWRAANAFALGHASKLAYENDRNKILAEVENWGFPASSCRVFSENTAQVLAAANNAMVVIAFRGTQPGLLADCLVDAEIIQKPWRDFFGEPGLGRVHHGFTRNTAFVWEQLSQFVAGARAGGQPLWITGHSLGGAMAVIAGAAFAFSEHQPVNGIYTFGQPRIGNRAFSTSCNHQFRTTLFRVVNNQDLVPRVPPAFIPFLLIPLHGPIFYRHGGRLMHFNAKGKLRESPDLWRRTAFRLVTLRYHTNARLRAAPPGFAPLDDHSLDTYIQKLQAWLDAGNP